MPDLLERIATALADRYAVEAEIGRGGMATVFLAEDLKHHRKVAVKVMHPELAATVGSERFLREIESAAGLSHPNILPLHDSGEADGLLFYVMPYVAGESLRTRLARERNLPVDEAVRIARETGEALDYAHRHGLVHRDVKPGNILLEEGHAVIADFGVARAIRDADGDQVTATGLAVGTPAYMSPEQAAGEPVDPRTDVYALACVLYEMLAGEPPLVGPTPQSTAAKRLTDRPTPLSALRDTVSPGLSATIEKALARVPADRFDSAGEFARILEDPGLPFPSPQTPDRTTRHRALSLGLSLVVLVFAMVALGQLLFRANASGDEHAIAPTTADAAERPSVAVLPLANRSGREEDVFFTEAFHDELLTRLAMIGGLKVISRTSVLGYQEVERSLPEIGSELGARYVIEGGVFRAGDDVRINLQLIDARDDSHVWAGTWDRELTIESLLSVQEEVAREVAAAVQTEIHPAELAAIAQPATLDMDAYEAYLRGRQFGARSYTREDLEAAEAMFASAIGTDSTFALAWAFLASTVARSYFFHYERTEERARLALRAATRAIELDPDLAQAHFAMAEYWYHVPIDLNRALQEYLVARRGAPNDDEIVAGIGFVKRRQGDWWAARDYLAEAVELNPLSGNLLNDLGQTQFGLRQYGEAARTLERTIDLVPENKDVYGYLSRLYLVTNRRTTEARGILDRLPPEVYDTGSGDLIRARLNVELADRDYPAALEFLRHAPESIEDQFTFSPRTLLVAQVLTLLGDPAAASAQFDSARLLIERHLRQSPSDHRAQNALGLALAGLGQHAEALAAVRRSLEIMPDHREAWKAAFAHEALARIHAMEGDRDKAMDELEFIVARPTLLGVLPLQMDPFWDMLRGDPRFEELVRASELPIPEAPPPGSSVAGR